MCSTSRTINNIIENNIAALRTQRDLNCIREGIDATQDGLAGVLSVNDLFCHCSSVLFLAGCFADLSKNSNDFVFSQDQIVLRINLDFRSGILSKQYSIPFLYFQGHY